MGRRVIWTNAAEADLSAAAEYIHRDSPAYAASFVNRALEAGRSLTDFAKREFRGRSWFNNLISGDLASCYHPLTD